VAETKSPQKTIQTFKSDNKVTWCPGCGDFSVLHAVYKTLVDLDYDPKDVVIASGIGCSGRFPIFMKSYGFHGVHGRVLPTATGIKLANPKLKVIAIGGDGDGLAIGAGHFPHAARRNIDITYIMLDNSIYGLTKGQGSPTTTSDFSVHSGQPYGTVEEALNPIALALAYNCTWVARGYSGELNLLIDLIIKAVKHKGFSFLHCISPCVVYNNTYPYYNKRVTKIPASHDVNDKRKALDLWQDKGKVYLGTFYEQKGDQVFSSRWEDVRNKAKQDGVANIDQVFSQYL